MDLRNRFKLILISLPTTLNKLKKTTNLQLIGASLIMVQISQNVLLSLKYINIKKMFHLVSKNT